MNSIRKDGFGKHSDSVGFLLLSQKSAKSYQVWAAVGNGESVAAKG